MPRVTTTLTVTTNTAIDRERIIHRLAKTIRKITQGLDAGQSDVNVSMSSYTDEKPQVDLDALADWEKELIAETAIVMPPAKAETPEPGFPYTQLTGEEGPVDIAKYLVADMINNETGLFYSDSRFAAVAMTTLDNGWVVVLKCLDRDECRYEVTQSLEKKETLIETYKYDRAITIVHAE